jgi:hypothetical protein
MKARSTYKMQTKFQSISCSYSKTLRLFNTKEIVLLNLFVLVLTIVPCALLKPQCYPDQIGVNLDFRGHTYVDAINGTTRWRALEGDGGPVLQDGWPAEDFEVVVMDWRPVPEWAGEIDDPEEYRIDVSGIYKMWFNGLADVTVAANPGNNVTLSSQWYDESTNTTAMDVVMNTPGPHHGLIFLRFSNTQRDTDSPANTGIANLKLIIPGYHERPEQLFTDEAVTAALPFQVMRHMGTLKTNDKVTWNDSGNWLEWSERVCPGQVHYDGLSTDAGWPWEHVAAFSNATGNDAWINIPIAASDEYIASLAALLNSKLDPGIDIYVEYSNEIWNPGFKQFNWASAKANERGLSLPQFAAHRTAEISTIFRDEFGADTINNRIKVILSYFAAWWDHNTSRGMLNYINRNFGPPSDYVWGHAVTGYIDGDMNVNTVEGFLQSMWNGLPDHYATYAAIASGFGLGLVVYEGGGNTSPGFDGYPETAAVRITADRRPEMADIYKQNLNNFFDAGGRLFMQFTLSSGYNRYGTWGLTDDLTILDRNHKYQAHLELMCKDWPEIIIGVDLEEPGPPDSFRLYQNYPNPFNPNTVIGYRLIVSGDVNLKVFDILGREVVTLIDEEQTPGIYEVEFNAVANYQFTPASGVYLYQLKAGDYTATKKMLLLR